MGAVSRDETIVAVAACADGHVLEACAEANRRGIARFLLIGDAAHTREICRDAGLDLDDCEIIDEPDNLLACSRAVDFVRQGKANALMKGLVDTSVIMKAALNRESGIRTGRKLSHLAVFEIEKYHKLLFLSDAAINIAPDLADKKEIITNAVLAMNNLGFNKPKAALLAAKEKPDEKMPCTLDCAELVEMHKKGDFGMCNFIMDGPLALDNAICAEACAIKGINSPVGGDADLLIAPDIEAGNMLYKSLVYFANARCGGVVLGAARPIILTSRADSADSKLISIALSVLC
ncbi:MAG: bifunctional enoyl-CoA hydratase/phosphate acetyltransferase [Defluviitaleaceae bacterium]|nr:bifunctional enoyl-CoA hydratase/phosphate acetyltransferase [Defluviitaleaceae bacterium]